MSDYLFEEPPDEYIIDDEQDLEVRECPRCDGFGCMYCEGTGTVRNEC